MAKETQHDTLAIPDQTAAPQFQEAFADGGIDISGAFNPKDPKGRQDVPTPGMQAGGGNQYHQPTSHYDTTMGAFDSDPSLDGKENEAAQRPDIPVFENHGGVPDPFGASMCNDVNFNAVAPYKYSEFPADSIPSTGYAGALKKKNPSLLG